MQKVIVLPFLCLFFLTVTTGTLAKDADQWVKITPMPHCTEMKIEYTFDSSGYQVRYQKTPGGEYKTHPVKLDDINDLSELTDQLVALSNIYCPIDLTTEQNPSQVVCSDGTVVDINPFSQKYADLLKQIISEVDKAGNNCKDVIPLISLQEQISQLKGQELIDFDSSGSILKLFVGSETDNMIDHFYECGGKKGTTQFIENLILLESKNACLFPSPPGLLALDKAKEIAKKVASEYEPMSIIGLNSKKNHIIKNTVVSFADVILKEQASALLGEGADVDGFINSLDSINKLKTIKDSKTLDYTSFGLAIDAPFEIIDKGMPLFIDANFKAMLPESMSDEDKSKFLLENVVPIVNKDYQECIAPYKERVQYPHGDRKLKKVLKHRKKLQKKFCSANEASCNQVGCGSVKNILTDRADIKDFGVLQACILKGVTNTLPTMLDKIIMGQREAFAEYFDLTPELGNRLSTVAYDEILKCADKKFKENHNQNYNKPFNENIEVLYHVSPDEYKDTLLECAVNAEEQLTGDFVTLLLSGTPVAVEAFGTGRKVDFYGKEIDEGILQIRNIDVKDTLTSCIDSQRSQANKKNGDRVSAISCRPMIEMTIGHKVIDKSLKKTLAEYDLGNDIRSIQLRSHFKDCTREALENANASFFNKDHVNPIYDAKDAEKFLHNDQNYYQCVTKAVSGVSQLVADKSIDKMVLNLSEEIIDQETGKVLKRAKLSDPYYVNQLKPGISDQVVRCFEDKMKNIGSWPKFLEYNEADGIKQLQKQCTDVAMEYSLPKIILNETATKVLALEDFKLVTNEQRNNVNNKIALSLKEEYKIDIPSRVSAEDRNDYIVKHAFRKYKLRNPNDKDPLNSFIKVYTQHAQVEGIEDIRNNIVEDIIESSKPGFDFSDLRDRISPACLNKFFNMHKPGLDGITEILEEKKFLEEKEAAKKGITLPEKPIPDLRTTFVEILRKGLIRASQKEGQYKRFLDNVEMLCENPEDYKDVKDIAKLGLINNVLLSQISEKVISKFGEAAEAQCYEELKDQNIKLPIVEETLVCSRENPSVEDLRKLRKKLKELVPDSIKQAKLLFALDRKVEMLRLVNSKLGSPSKFDAMFEDDSDILDYIYANFDKVVTNDETTMDALNLKVLDKLFEDRSKDGFASRFTELQLVAGVGLGGMQDAKEKVDASLNELGVLESIFRKKVVVRGNAAFYNRWQTKGVKYYLNWDNLEAPARARLIDQVYKKGILSKMDSKLKEDDVDALKAELTKEVTAHVSDTAHKNWPNPDYAPEKKTRIYDPHGSYVITTPEKGPKFFTFPQKLAYDISKQVGDSVKSDLNPLD